MPDLSRHVASSASHKPRVLVVRQPVRSVRPGDIGPGGPFILALAALCAAGAVGAAWLIGYLGFRLGFASLMGVSELAAAPAEGLANGVRQLLYSPVIVFRAGLIDPILLMAGFLTIAVPAAALAATRPFARGGPRPPTIAIVLSTIAASLAIVIAAGLVTWIVQPSRINALAEIPRGSEAAATWLDSVLYFAGGDTLAAVAAVLWTVLAFRLAIPRWLRALAVTAMMIAATVSLVGWAASSSIAVELARTRPVAGLAGGGGGVLLGYTPGHTVLLRVVGEDTMIDFRPMDERMEVIRHVSIAELIRARALAAPE